MSLGDHGQKFHKKRVKNFMSITKQERSHTSTTSQRASTRVAQTPNAKIRSDCCSTQNIVRFWSCG